MSKLLVVFGATGQQGGSVIDFVLNDPELSKEYALRAITRNVSSAAAQALQTRGVKVVAGDVDDAASLPAALANAHTVFIVTASVYDDQLKAREYAQTKAAADAAVAAGAQYLIYSTCVACERLWGRPVPAFDSKADAEAYIRSLPVQSAFFAPAMFMQNFLTNQAARPIPAAADGAPPTYAIANFIAPDAPFPIIETVRDTGKYVGAILAAPDAYAGVTLSAATGLVTYRECAETITRVTGKQTVYAQLPQEQWSSFLPPGSAGPLTAMMRWLESPGYYGPRTKEEVEWTAQRARGKLTSFEEFVEEHKDEIFAQ
ncbi:uncharacterized protein N7459_008921 [Penicillium hispanicum]|uniref:uncharacterized protein n=1 Tax=Penicillium hispanicum TaxID=1080232 RepID=UPI0025401B15|nr:uncharacterized protein N7459_008921 [Penicillium hispanicum]KAJ5569491.1 hypothetical protein N7459_008921 [Penicillium hispanicum]